MLGSQYLKITNSHGSRRWLSLKIIACIKIEIKYLKKMSLGHYLKTRKIPFLNIITKVDIGT